MTVQDSPMTVTLTASTFGALRALVTGRIGESERWLRVHRATASVNARRNAQRSLDQLYTLRSQIERAADDEFDRTVAEATARLQAEAAQ